MWPAKSFTMSSRKSCKLAWFLLAASILNAQREDPPFALPGAVESIPNIVYTGGAGPAKQLDLFLPKNGSGPFPAVVYVHGGGWNAGSKTAFRRQAAYMATKGFVGACISYRLSQEATYPAALHDSKAAVRWMRANARKYRINPDAIGAAGGSAGGHLVALLGTTGDLPELEGDRGSAGFSSRVQAVAAFNPVVDFVSIGKRASGNAINSVVQFMGAPYAANPQLWAEASPMTHVSKDSAPFLLLHGNADQVVPYQQSLDMRDKLKAAGVEVELFTGEGGGHGFFNKPPYYEPALAAMEAFFGRKLR